VVEGNLPQYTDIIYAFANTGQEHKNSLVFADYIDRKFCKGKLVWLESVVNHGVKKACGHRIVDFNSATRDESLFEEMIKKYGIPNKAYPHCTRALKLDPLTSYLRSVGWRKGSYDTAIGIRADEVDRVSINAKKKPDNLSAC
jgi:3'-phosphoadenosine 5'-phosphosulfate sulfotransferase (PAPS reductase)/FAD synthetase